MTANTSLLHSRSDIIGAAASGLCVVHCISTPFLFIAQSCSLSGCCDASPNWWSSLDYAFIGITLLAISYSIKNSSKQWIKYALFASWALLTFFILDEKFGFVGASETWKYLSSALLVGFHLYNLRYCQCADENCCIHQTNATT